MSNCHWKDFKLLSSSSCGIMIHWGFGFHILICKWMDQLGIFSSAKIYIDICDTAVQCRHACTRTHACTHKHTHTHTHTSTETKEHSKDNFCNHGYYRTWVYANIQITWVWVKIFLLLATHNYSSFHSLLLFGHFVNGV